MTDSKEQQAPGDELADGQCVSANDLRQVMRRWPSGVSVVTSADGAARAGMTVSAFTSVTLEPALVLVCLGKQAWCTELVRRTRHLSISVLGREQQELAERFGRPESDALKDRFVGVVLEAHDGPAPWLAGAEAWLACRVWRLRDLGSHLAVAALVTEVRTGDGVANPLVYANQAYRGVME